MKLPADPATIIAESRATSQEQGARAFPEVWEIFENSLIVLVYGSNMIETAGANLRITIKLCRGIFRGLPVGEYIDERSPEYQEHLETLLKTYRKGDMGGVIQSRKEIIQHAKALSFIIEEVILDNQPISE